MWYNYALGLESVGLALVSFIIGRFFSKKHEVLISILCALLHVGVAVLMVLCFRSAMTAEVTHFFSKDAITWATLWPDLLLAGIFLVDAFLLFASSFLLLGTLFEYRQKDAPLLILPGFLMPILTFVGWIVFLTVMRSEYTEAHKTAIAIAVAVGAYLICVLLGRIMTPKEGAPARYVWLYSAEAVINWPIIICAAIGGLILLVSAFWKWILAAIAAVAAVIFLTSQFAKDAMKSSPAPKMLYDSAGHAHYNEDDRRRANEKIKQNRENK